MKLLFILLFSSLSFCANKVHDVTSNKEKVTHEIWDLLLKEHVHANGLVDYTGIKNSQKFETYLSILSSQHPGDNWSRNEKMAYWINVYNAFTVKLIVDHLPISSIKDIKKGIPFVNTVWDIKFIKIQGKTYDLNNIEHGILRKKFKDARIHGAINCASISCPNLRPEAFTSENLDAQLDDSMAKFINDPSKNNISQNEVQLSKIFTWFGGDFKKNKGSVIKFINQYSKIKIGDKESIQYLDYNWSLNSTKEI